MGGTEICKVHLKESGFRMGNPSGKGEELVLKSRGGSSTPPLPPGQQYILREFFPDPSEVFPNLSSATPYSSLFTVLGRRKASAHCFCLPHPRPGGQGLSAPLSRFFPSRAPACHCFRLGSHDKTQNESVNTPMSESCISLSLKQPFKHRSDGIVSLPREPSHSLRVAWKLASS